MKDTFKDFSELLIEITGGTKPFATVAEIADVMGVNVQTAYGYRTGNSEPSFRSVRALNAHMIRSYGYYGIQRQMFISCFSGKANGRVDDELLNIYDACTDVHRSYSEGDKRTFEDSVSRIEQECKILHKEGGELK